MADRTTPRRKAYKIENNKGAAKRAEAYFAKIGALNADIDSGSTSEKIAARRAKAGMRDTWTKRDTKNVTGFHKPKAKGPRYQA